MYLSAVRRFDSKSAAAKAILKAAGITLAALKKRMAKSEEEEDSGEIYLSAWSHQKDDLPEKKRALAVHAAAGLTEFRTEHTGGGGLGWEDGKLYVKRSCVYWRKTNSVHAWFVEKCQGGVDECQATPVEAGKLKELREQCQKAHALALAGAKESAAAILPTREGFFFGGTDIDEFYIQDMQRTVEELDRVLALAEKAGDIEFEYRASW